MSVKASSHVWNNSQHSGGTLLILLALADFADDDGFCWPSVETLATKARMSERNARYILRSLEASGEIATTERGGRHGTNGYRIVAMATGAGGAILAGGQHIAGRGGKTRHVKGQPIAPEPSRTIIEPSEKDIAPHVTARPSPSAPKPSPKPPTTRAPRPMFDAFMAAFPKAPASLAGRFDAACAQAGLTLDRWHAFMADRKVRESYTDGFLTRNNAGDRFHAWAKTSATRRDPTREAGDNGASLAARNEAFLKAKGWA